MKGICFIPPLFDLTITGYKKQTRRIIKIKDCSKSHTNFSGAVWKNEPMKIIPGNFNGLDNNWDGTYYCKYCGNGDGKLKPRYQVGDIVFLKEPYKIQKIKGSCSKYEITYYFAENSKIIDSVKLKIPSIKIANIFIQQKKSKSGYANKLFMPEWAARRYIKITGVGCERLQDISDDDCFKEGIKYEYWATMPELSGYNNLIEDTNFAFPKNAYAAFINFINGEGTWESNPYVWIYDYELIKLNI